MRSNWRMAGKAVKKGGSSTDLEGKRERGSMHEWACAAQGRATATAVRSPRGRRRGDEPAWGAVVVEARTVTTGARMRARGGDRLGWQQSGQAAGAGEGQQGNLPVGFEQRGDWSTYALDCGLVLAC